MGKRWPDWAPWEIKSNSESGGKKGQSGSLFPGLSQEYGSISGFSFSPTYSHPALSLHIWLCFMSHTLGKVNVC